MTITSRYSQKVTFLVCAKLYIKTQENEFKTDEIQHYLENFNWGTQLYCKENIENHQHFWKIVRSYVLF